MQDTSVDFSPDAYEILQSACKALDMSISDTLRAALSLLVYVHGVQQSGGAILIRVGGKIVQLSGEFL